MNEETEPRGEKRTYGLDGPGAVPTVTAGPENLAIAILAALRGGATLCWLAEDARSLEAALGIALAPVLPSREADGPDDRHPR